MIDTQKRVWSRGLVVKVTAAVIAVVGVVLSALTAVFSGIGWDAPFEVELGSVLLVTSADSQSVEVLTNAVATQDLSKGPQIFWLAQALGSILPLEPWTGSIEDPNNYALLGLSSVLLGTVGIGLLATGIGIALRSAGLGWVAFALMTTMPLWVGLSAVDYRDTQVASGLAAVSAAGVLLITNPRTRAILYAAGGFAAVGAYLAIGGRSGSVLLLIVLLAWIVGTTLIVRRNDLKVALIHSALVAAGALVGAVLAVASHPIGRYSPIAWLVEAVEFASANPNVMLVRVMGQNVTSSESPWWYVPAWLIAQLPLLTLVVVALVAVGFFWWKPRSRRGSPTATAVILLLGQAVALPTLVLLARPNIYDGIRHFLFMIPALFGLLAVAAWSLRGRRPLRSTVNHPLGTAAILWTLIAVAALSAFASARWYPYSYAFVNPVAGAIKEPRIWEYDYWGLATREAISQLETTTGASEIFIRPSARSALPFGGRDFEDYLEDPSGRWAGVTFFRFDAELPQQCEPTIVISRDGIPLAEAGTCS